MRILMKILLFKMLIEVFSSTRHWTFFELSSATPRHFRLQFSETKFLKLFREEIFENCVILEGMS